MAHEPIKLFTDAYWISPYVMTCFVGLKEKALPFETETVSLGDREHLAPAYRDASVTARVPAALHDGFWIGESSAIVEYLDEAFPAPAHPRVLPESTRERARARQIMAWLRSDLGALREERSTSTMFYARADKQLTKEGRAAADKLLRVARLLVREGATSMFDVWCIADADLAFALHRLILNGDDVDANLCAYAQATWRRPSLRAFVERERPPFVPY